MSASSVVENLKHPINYLIGVCNFWGL